MPNLRLHIQGAVVMGSMLAGAMILLSQVAALELLQHRNEAKLLLEIWERMFNGGAPLTLILTFGTSALYARGAYEVPRKRKEFVAAAVLTTIGDPISYVATNVLTDKLIKWTEESVTYSLLNSLYYGEAAREMITWWITLYFLRSMEVLVGVWMGMRHMPESWSGREGLAQRVGGQDQRAMTF